MPPTERVPRSGIITPRAAAVNSRRTGHGRGDQRAAGRASLAEAIEFGKIVLRDRAALGRDQRPHPVAEVAGIRERRASAEAVQQAGAERIAATHRVHNRNPVSRGVEHLRAAARERAIGPQGDAHQVAVELAGDDRKQFPQFLPPETEQLVHHPCLVVVHLDDVRAAHGVVEQIAVEIIAPERQVQEHLPDAGTLQHAAQGGTRGAPGIIAKSEQPVTHKLWINPVDNWVEITCPR